MNYDKIDAKALGQSLKGLGINLLVSSVKNTSTFLRTIFNIELFQQTDDFAIAKYENQIFQLHADTTYHNNPLPSLLPANGARGAGVEIRLYNSNPDVAVIEKHYANNIKSKHSEERLSSLEIIK